MKLLIKLIITITITTQLMLSMVGGAQEAVNDAANERHAIMSSIVSE